VGVSKVSSRWLWEAFGFFVGVSKVSSRWLWEAFDFLIEVSEVSSRWLCFGRKVKAAARSKPSAL